MFITDFKKKLFAFSIAALAVCALYAQQEISFLQPEKTTDISGEDTEFIIRTDKKDARVYINENYMGLTPLTITKLVPGEYCLSVRNEDGTKVFQIKVKRFLRQEYYIEMSGEKEQIEQGSKTGKYKYQYGPRQND